MLLYEKKELAHWKSTRQNLEVAGSIPVFFLLYFSCFLKLLKLNRKVLDTMSNFLNQAKLYCKRNGSTILTCVGGVGVVATSVLAVKATPKALKAIEEAENMKGEALTRIEVVKVAWKPYIPAVVTGVGTLTCMFGANVLNKCHQAALVSAYTLIDSSFKEYKQKLKELYGEEAHEKIEEAIAAEKAKNVGVNAPGIISNNALYVDEKCGDTRLFYDNYGDRFFEATLEQVISAEYHTNRNYVLRGYTILNELYEFLGLEPTDYGNEVGWCAYDEGTFWVDFNHIKTTVKGRECIIIDMPFGPDLEWQEYYC